MYWFGNNLIYRYIKQMLLTTARGGQAKKEATEAEACQQEEKFGEFTARCRQESQGVWEKGV